MNSLKTLAVVAVLGAVAYGVYVTVHRNAPPVPPPPGGWPEGPPQQLPNLDAMTPQLGESGTTPAGGSAVPGGPISVGGAEATGIPPIGAPAATGNPPSGVGTAGGDPTAAPPFSGGPASASSTAPPYPEGTSADQAQAGPPAASAPPYPGQAAEPPQMPGFSGSAPDVPARGAAAEGVPGSGDDIRARFEDLMKTVDQKLAAGELAEAHLALSSLYGNPNLPVEMSHQVIALLDQLAGTVIYSREHYLEDPYTVQPGDTMETIARNYDVPPQVLRRINGIRGPEDLQPGRQLKVIRGPFRAVVDLEKYELTLMLGRRYAGRFPIGVGEDHVRLEGTYTVQNKVTNPPYDGPEGTIPADDPNNPLGEFYIDLGNYVGIHGTNDSRDLHRTAGRGAIRLADRDIDDLYGILSVGSQVVVRQ